MARFLVRLKGTIHDNPELTVMNKFTILLKEVPYDAVNSYIARREQGYPRAVRDLLFKYHRPDDIRSMIISQYTNRKPIADKYDLEGMTKLANDLRSTHGVLEMINTPKSFYTTNLMHKIFPLMPQKCKSLLCDRGTMYYSAVIAALETRVGSLTNSKAMMNHDPQFATRQPVEKKPAPSAAAAAPTRNRRGTIMTVAPSSLQGERLKNCPVCPSEDHAVGNCTRYVGKARGDRVKELQLCFRCLPNQHYLRQCDYKHKCPCGLAHRIEMCLRSGKPKEGTQFRNNAPAATQQQRALTVQPIEALADQVLPVAGTYLTRQSSGRAYLPVVSGQIKGDKKVASANILLDGGSTNCFISRRKAIELGLQIRKVDSFSVTGFGESQTTLDSEVTVQVYDADGRPVVRTNMYVTPFVIGVPVTQPSPAVRKRLLEKQIYYTVNPSLPRNEADVLIGAPFLHSVETGEKVMLSSNLAAINTVLGWAISGAEDDAQDKQLA